MLGIISTLYAYEDRTDSKFRNVGTKSSDVGRLPKKHNTPFNTRRKFEIKTNLLVSFQVVEKDHQVTVKEISI